MLDLYLLNETFADVSNHKMLTLVSLACIACAATLVVTRGRLFSGTLLMALFLNTITYVMLSLMSFISLFDIMLYIFSLSTLFVFVLMYAIVRTSELTSDSIPMYLNSSILVTLIWCIAPSLILILSVLVGLELLFSFGGLNPGFIISGGPTRSYLDILLIISGLIIVTGLILLSAPGERMSIKTILDSDIDLAARQPRGGNPRSMNLVFYNRPELFTRVVYDSNDISGGHLSDLCAGAFTQRAYISNRECIIMPYPAGTTFSNVTVTTAAVNSLTARGISIFSANRPIAMTLAPDLRHTTLHVREA